MAPIALSQEMREPPAKPSSDLDRFSKDDSRTIDLVLRQFRCLIADLCQQYNGGHPG